MPNVLTGTGTVTNLIQTAYDQAIGIALRNEPMFRNFADTRPTSVDKPGSSIVMQRFQDLAPATGTLTEDVDPDSVALPNTINVSVPLNEYGNSVMTTEKFKLESLANIDPMVADQVAYNMRDSLDIIVGAVLRGGTKYIREINGTLSLNTGNTNGIKATDKLASKHARVVVSKLRGAGAIPFEGGLYHGLIHPDQSLDFRSETGSAGWREIHNYSGATGVWTGDAGVYEGIRWIESPRIYQATDGDTSAKVSRALVLGKQALVEAVAKEPGIIVGPVTDKMMRFRPVSWYGLLGWARYREDCLYRIETSSSY